MLVVLSDFELLLARPVESQLAECFVRVCFKGGVQECEVVEAASGEGVVWCFVARGWSWRCFLLFFSVH